MKYKYQDPSGTYIITEDEIRTQYFPYWKERMEKIGKANEATFENCVSDFCIAHWAWEIKEQENANHPRGSEHI